MRRSTVGLRGLRFGHDARLETTDALAFRRAPASRRSRREALAVCASPRRLDHMRLSYLDGRHRRRTWFVCAGLLLAYFHSSACSPARAANRAQRRHRHRPESDEAGMGKVVVTVNDHFRAGARLAGAWRTAHSRRSIGSRRRSVSTSIEARRASRRSSWRQRTETASRCPCRGTAPDRSRRRRSGVGDQRSGKLAISVERFRAARIKLVAGSWKLEAIYEVP